MVFFAKPVNSRYPIYKRDLVFQLLTFALQLFQEVTFMQQVIHVSYFFHLYRHSIVCLYAPPLMYCAKRSIAYFLSNFKPTGHNCLNHFNLIKTTEIEEISLIYSVKIQCFFRFDLSFTGAISFFLSSGDYALKPLTAFTTNIGDELLMFNFFLRLQAS